MLFLKIINTLIITSPVVFQKFINRNDFIANLVKIGELLNYQPIILIYPIVPSSEDRPPI